MEHMYNQQTYDAAVQRCDDVIHGRKPDRVPMFALITEWAYYNAGYTEKEIVENPKLVGDSFVKLFTDIYFDVSFGVTPPQVLSYKEKLGGGNYKFSSTGIIEWDTTSVTCMYENEYPQLITDPWGFFEEVILPRKYSLFAEPYSEKKYKKFCDALDALADATKCMPDVLKYVNDKTPVPSIMDKGRYWHPFDVIMDYFRNFDGIMIDIRRRPQMVIDACEALQPAFLSLLDIENRPAQKGTAIMYPLHAPTYLKPKDYERFYWPCYRQLVEYLNDKGYVLLSFFEGNHEHLYDFYQSLPKNAVLGLFEHDDLVKTKASIGDTICIAGGLNTFMLRNGTKEQCIDMAKKTVDELAPGGGYISTTDKQLSCCANEVNPENYAAVNDFLQEYAVY
ncbi:MAG: uroporphyrinogen decarboxylase family protein [Eubacteriales bacterium]